MRQVDRHKLSTKLPFPGWQEASAHKLKRFSIRLLFVAQERKANKQANFVAGKAGNLALYEVKLVLFPSNLCLQTCFGRIDSRHWFTVHFNLSVVYCTQDEIHKRPRISTLLESLSRYEAVASPQQDDEEGEAKTAKSSQVRVHKSTLLLEQSNVD